MLCTYAYACIKTRDACIHACYTDAFFRDTYSYTHTYTYTRIHRVNPIAVIYMTLLSRFPPLFTLFFSLEQFFLIELNIIHRQIHGHANTNTHVRTYSPPVAMLFCFFTWKAFFRCLIPCRKERKMKRWKRKIYIIYGEKKGERGELIMKGK